MTDAERDPERPHPIGRDIGRINLAHEAPLRLGALSIEPALRRVAHDDGREEIVEPRVMQVLIALVRADGKILTRDDLMMSCWHGVVVGEDAINRVMGRVRRLADGIGGGAFKLETITKVGYRLVPTDTHVEIGPAAQPSDVQPSASKVAAADPLLAVLAFDDLSGEADMAWFSDGVSEEILQTVARGADLRVIGRGSSFQFRGAEKAAAHVATSLKATHVLDGSVRRSGEKVRIAAHLIECAGETTLWSDRFDRDLSDVFALQDEIAGAVAVALKIAFAPAAQREAIDPTAYNLYLKALEIRNRGLEEKTLPAVIELLDEATTLAPNFARAWVFLATMQAECLDFDEPEQPHAVTRAKVVEATETALRLDPSLGAAHQALGQLKPFGRFAEREALHRKALSVAPNDPTVLTNASLFFAEIGRIHEAVECARQAYSLDPMSPWAANWYACLLADYAGRIEEGRALWESLGALWPDNELIAWSVILSASGHRDWARFDDLVALAGERGLDTPILRHVISVGRARREPDLEKQTQALQGARDRLAKTNTLPLWTFTILYGLGLTDEVFELIDQASFALMFDSDQRSPNGAYGGSGIFSPVHKHGMDRDLRFVGLCNKLGLCEYWAKTGRWPDCAEALAPYYDLKAEARRLAEA